MDQIFRGALIFVVERNHENLFVHVHVYGTILRKLKVDGNYTIVYMYSVKSFNAHKIRIEPELWKCIFGFLKVILLTQIPNEPLMFSAW